MFRTSPQKLAMLGRQITGLPLDAAMLQMQFSHKRAAKTVYSTLCDAWSKVQMRISQSPASNKTSVPPMIIKQALVGRGKYIKRLDIKGRGRHGVIWSPHAFMRILLERSNVEKDLRKLLEVKRFPKENKPVYCKLDYY